jgi:hypothetical protein
MICSHKIFVFINLGYYNRYHKLGGLKKTYFSLFWRMGRPKSRYWQTWCLARAYFLAHSWMYFFAMSSHGRRGKNTPWGIFYKGTNPAHEGCRLITESPPKGLNSFIFFILGFEHRAFHLLG